MRWPYVVVLAITVAGITVIEADKIAGITKTGEESTVTAGASNFEKSPAKLKKLINVHRAFHEKVKIVFANLIEELEPHIEYSDARELQKLTNDLLNQYGDEINGAEKALQANDIVLANVFLANAAKELKNLYSAQKTLLDLRNQLVPKSPKRKSNETIKSASIPGKQTRGCSFNRRLLHFFILYIRMFSIYMSETTQQNLYELSYFISSKIKDEDVISHVDKIKGLISSKKGEVVKEEIPHRRRLAYPIRRQTDGFFGYFHFSSPAGNTTKEISGSLSLDPSILRHLLIAVDKKQIAQMKKSTQSVSAQEKVKKMMHKAKEEESIFKKEDAVSHLEEHKVELEELDKKLEEILNK